MNLEAARSLDRSALEREAALLKFETRNFIDGRFVDAQSGETFPCVNPANAKPFCEVAHSTASDVDAAVMSARRKYNSGCWSRIAPRSRMDVLFRLARLIEQNALEFALLDVLNVGKPVADMWSVDIPLATLTFQFFAETIDKIAGDVTNTAHSDLHMILREPLGVVGGIVPWNYPLLNAAWKVAPALAAGNTVVLKTAEQSPLSANLLAKLFIDAGGPAGVFNVVHGYGEKAGQPLALHMDVDKISFTGSVEVGKLMHVYSGQSNMKRVSTECGGKTPQIVMKDADDLEKVVQAAINGIFVNQGEVCNAGSRMLVEAEIYDEFVELFVNMSRDQFRPGDPLDPATSLGPLVSKPHQDRVLDYIQIGKREGANVAKGGTVPSGIGKGYYVEPTLFTGVKNDMKIAQEEIFGPVGVVIPFRGYEQAMNIANDSIYGLAASIWTNDMKTAIRAARNFQAGVVWVNCFDVGDMTQPWGGYKQTGSGRDKCLETMSQYSQTKSVWINVE